MIALSLAIGPAASSTAHKCQYSSVLGSIMSQCHLCLHNSTSRLAAQLSSASPAGHLRLQLSSVNPSTSSKPSSSCGSCQQGSMCSVRRICCRHKQAQQQHAPTNLPCSTQKQTSALAQPAPCLGQTCTAANCMSQRHRKYVNSKFGVCSSNTSPAGGSSEQAGQGSTHILLPILLQSVS